MPTNINPTNRTNTMKMMFSHIPLTTKWTKFTDRVYAFLYIYTFNLISMIILKTLNNYFRLLMSLRVNLYSQLMITLLSILLVILKKENIHIFKGLNVTALMKCPVLNGDLDNNHQIQSVK